MEIGNVVGRVYRAINGVDIDAFLERWRQPTRQDGGASDFILPANDLAVRKGRGNCVAIDRTINIVLDVFLASPHHLDGTIDMLRNSDSLNHHVGLEPAAKTAAEQVIVRDHFLDRKPGRFCPL
jgi:hypothetical protein